MSRFWEIAFCLPLLFRRHVCLSKLKHSPLRELPLTARKTVFSHLKASPLSQSQLDDIAHEQTIISRQLFAILVPEPVVSWSRGRETTTGRLQIKPSGSGDENDYLQVTWWALDQ